MNIFVHISFAESLNTWVNKLVVAYGDALHKFSGIVLRGFLIPIEHLLQAAPPLLIIALVAAISYNAYRRWIPTISFTLAFYFIGCLGLWEKTIQTLTIMIVSIIICLIIGIPSGIFMARHRRLSFFMTPVLDVMQTFPMFVYMLPAVMLFSIGKIPAVFATVIYALPPLIRLTELGIRQVDGEIREAAWSFGINKKQMLLWVELPLARPSIMAGINQTTMSALAMVVVASMIGARGLGEDILDGLTNLNFGKGTNAGIAVVILAIVIDRISQAYGTASRYKKRGKNKEILLGNDDEF